ncbi:MAG: hypothetical protein HYS13_07485 [Planctomycetia bacterium]|nr:hypothetical protein [Planctomycetia bacterium]
MTAAIDLERDTLTPVRQLVRQRLGKNISPPTQWRWILKGVKAGNGRVRLEAVRVGATWCSTPAALARFFEAQTAAALASSVDDDRTRSGRSETVERRLRKAGLLRDPEEAADE